MTGRCARCGLLSNFLVSGLAGPMHKHCRANEREEQALLRKREQAPPPKQESP